MVSNSEVKQGMNDAFRVSVEPQNGKRLRDLSGRFLKMDAAGYAAVQIQMALLGSELAHHTREEYLAGGHPQGPGYNSIRVELRGTRLELMLSQGLIYVDKGTAAHEIWASNDAGVLVWQDPATGESVFISTRYQPVESPGITADPFVQRALKRTNIPAHLRQVGARMAEEAMPNAEGLEKFQHAGAGNDGNVL